jgi:hypothetical protein
LAIVVLASSICSCTERQGSEPPFGPPTEPAPGPLSTQGYVYDDKLGYGFDYPGGWEFLVEEGDFPDKNIKKVVSFEKIFKKQFEGSDYESEVSVDLEFMVKSATDLQEITDEFKKKAEMSGLPILNEATISVNNIDGYDILCGDSETPTWKLRQVVFFANGTAYIFTYQSQEEFYRMYEKTFNNTINSFNIKKKA